jgi:inorganic phosphate transporter, PiT family
MAGLLLIIGLTGLYGYINGLHGSASVVATVISSRALGPRAALWLAAIGIGLGPFVFGVAVAQTLGTELIRPEIATVPVIAASLIGAIAWSTITLWLRIPSSISQALIGAIIGASWAAMGSAGVQVAGLHKVILALFMSPVIGLLSAYVLMRLVYRLGHLATPAINKWFRRLQILASLLVAASFGANDGQKLMAMLALGLAAVGMQEGFTISVWVVGYSALSIVLGTLVGGQRLIHTLGNKFYKVRPVHGFGSQLISGFIILTAGLTGSPVSGSQVMTSAIIGSGSADRIQKIRWGIVQQIVMGWLLTLPLSALTGYLTWQIISRAYVS